ncbi:hypothetical protein [Mangrovihabitans endophyticus]|uniref:Uncharacterized protein n=1 Tax=Mangrovihabitans endophyticus TaxID=1751298 RepID=A0A8J3FQB9_9ACTN|nr:hypothetical protein [Mangrovihabitans endophyticus]GGL02143.1 hypothetical protein GCM10012284_40850 [Mangrovihabitans endophyticus]
MEMAMEIGYGLIEDAFGESSPVPWWAWMGALGMVFWGLLVPGAKDVRPAADDDDRLRAAEAALGRRS